MKIKTSTLGAALLSAAATLFAPYPLQACGGFFPASLDKPTQQSGVRAVLFRDGKHLEVHATVSYDGPAEGFAWLIPVPSVPEIRPSSDLLFFGLDEISRPVFDGRLSGGSAQTDNEYACMDIALARQCPHHSTLWPAGKVKAGNNSAAVHVVQASTVGPFETATLQAKSAGDLATWLTKNGYKVTPGSEPLLQSYLDRGHVFVALRLSPGQGTGDLVPISLRFEDPATCLPLRLASLTAKGHIPVVVWVIGEGTAFPRNGLVASLNRGRINPANPYSNYGATLQSAIEASGNGAWVIESSRELSYDGVGDTFDETTRLWGKWRGWLSAPVQAETTTPAVVLSALASAGIPLTANVISSLVAAGARPKKAAQVDTATYAACVLHCPGAKPDQADCASADCKTSLAAIEGVTLNRKTVAKAFEETLEPVWRLAQNFITKKYRLTRLAARVSAAQLDRDAVFQFRDDLSDNDAPGHDAEKYSEQWLTPVCDHSEEPPVLLGASHDGQLVELPASASECAGKWGVSMTFVEPTKPMSVHPGPALRWLTLIDEQGPPRRIHPDDADKVSAAIANAKPCRPALDAALVATLKPTKEPAEWHAKWDDVPAWTGCPVAVEDAKTPPDVQEPGCSASRRSSNAAFWTFCTLALAAAAILRRRRV